MPDAINLPAPFTAKFGAPETMQTFVDIANADEEHYASGYVN